MDKPGVVAPAFEHSADYRADVEDKVEACARNLFEGMVTDERS